MQEGEIKGREKIKNTKKHKKKQKRKREKRVEKSRDSIRLHNAIFQVTRDKDLAMHAILHFRLTLQIFNTDFYDEIRHENDLQITTEDIGLL